MGLWGTIKKKAKGAAKAVKKATKTRVGKGASFLGQTWAEVYGGPYVILGEGAYSAIKNRSLKAGYDLVKGKVEERIEYAGQFLSGDWGGLASNVGQKFSKESGGSLEEQAKVASIAGKVGKYGGNYATQNGYLQKPGGNEQLAANYQQVAGNQFQSAAQGTPVEGMGLSSFFGIFSSSSPKQAGSRAAQTAASTASGKGYNTKSLFSWFLK